MKFVNINSMCQCPHGLLPHFYFGIADKIHPLYEGVSMPSRAVTSFLHSFKATQDPGVISVSMPSRAVTSFLHYPRLFAPFKTTVCQCPHGLLPHFYVVPFKIFRLETSPVSMPSRAVTSFLRGRTSHVRQQEQTCVNALTGCYLISTSKAHRLLRW